MTRLTITEARETLADILNRVAFQGERIVLLRHGKEAAALVSVEDLKALEELEDHLDNEAADVALMEAEEKGTVPWEEVKKRLGM